MRILPEPDELSAPYWSAAHEHRLAIQRCEGCGRLAHPPLASCPACHGRRFDWPTMSGRGTVYAFTVVHHSVHPVTASAVPYVLALVELEEGPRVLTNLRNCDVGAARVGLAVEVTFEDLDETTTLPQFQPATTKASVATSTRERLSRKPDLNERAFSRRRGNARLGNEHRESGS